MHYIFSLIKYEEDINPAIEQAINEGIYSGDVNTIRSEERRVGKECRRLCSSRWSPSH